MATVSSSRANNSPWASFRSWLGTTPTPASPLTRANKLWALAFSAIALLPLLRHWNDFSALFWLGDDLVVLDDLAHHGFGPWLGHLFAENFLPVFKLFWAAALYGGQSHYIVLIAACWVTHAVNVGLLSTWLFRNGFSLPAVAVTALVFGLSASNIETLGWAIQWSPVLSTTFLLCALHVWTSASAKPDTPGIGGCSLLFLACTASAFSFARGILSGIVVAILWAFERFDAQPRWRHVVFALAGLLPCLVSAVLVFKNIPRDTALLASADPHHWQRVFAFAGWYLGLNPIPHLLFGFFPKISVVNGAVYCAIKLAVVSAALTWATPTQRRVLFSLLLLEFGYAAQLGLGRWSLDGFLAMSSRYQYMSLLSFFPFVGVALERGLQRLTERPFLRAAIAAGLLLFAAWGANRLWAKLLPDWAEWRGRSSRRALFEAARSDPAPAMIGGVSPENAKRLTRHFNLR